METAAAPLPRAGTAPALDALCDTRQEPAALLAHRPGGTPVSGPHSGRPSPAPSAPRRPMAAPTLQAHVLDASDPRGVVATERQHLGTGWDASNYGADVHAIARHRRRERIRQASPLRTLHFAQAVVNETLARSGRGPTRAAATLAAVLAGTVGRRTRLDLGLADPGGFGDKGRAVGAAAARTSQEVASILDAVGPPTPVDPVDISFRARVADEMREWGEALAELAERVHCRAPGRAAVPAASVAAAGLALACAWAASMRGHPATAGMAVAHWREHGEASARLVAASAFGALEEPTAQLRAAWAAHGLAEGYARASFRDVARVVARALAPVFASGVVLCGEHAVLRMAARAAALVVVTSEYLALRTESMLVMFAVPMDSTARKRATDNHATLPVIDGFASSVLEMCRDLANHPTRAEVANLAKEAMQALEPCVQHYLPHASAQREGVPFERLALADLLAIILSNPPSPSPRHDPQLAKWHTTACETVSRLRLVRQPTVEEEKRAEPHRLLDERREARLVTTETAHRVLAEPASADSVWATTLGANWRGLFVRYANAKAAADRFAADVDGESEQAAGRRAEAHAAARADASSILEGNNAATRMWAVSNAAYAAMRYTSFGEAPYSLAAAPLDARVVSRDGGTPKEKCMATWVTAYPASLA